MKIRTGDAGLHRFSIILLLTLLIAPLAYSQGSKFDPYMQRAMELTGRPLPALVVMQPVSPVTAEYWDEMSPAQLEYQIKLRTLQVQSQLRGFVNQLVDDSNFGDSQVRDYMFLWSTNTFIGTVDQNILREMADYPEVEKIIYDRKVILSYDVEGEEGPEVLGQTEYTYGLEKIGVPDLRARAPEITGDGVVVGILDTGIDAKHPELQNKVIAWKDFVSGKDKPYDGNGHGTHVAGTIAGDGVTGTQIGIAPKAKLVIGKILSDEGSGRLSWIVRGMEWVVNPEQKLNSSLRPRVVNNSWGAALDPGSTDDIRSNPFTQQVATWVQMDIFPAFAAGNEGRSGRETIGTPGDLPMAFAVGATDSEDQVADFSSKGPARIIDMEGKEQVLVKPDISAPGVKILSSIPGGKYARFSGTSMATPHLVGGVALLYQANPHLTVPQMIQLLETTVDDLGPKGRDNDYGEGRLNVARAFNVMSSMF